jgi:uncharacterized protein YndB with AHSA1/START domain
MTEAESPGARAHEPTIFSQPSDRETRASRLFRAPVERVFRLFTDPATVPHLMSSDPGAVTIETMEFRPGGRFAFLVRQKDGSTVRFSGEYREIVPPRKVVNTFEVSLQPGVVAIETDEFEPVGEFTRITVTWQYTRTSDRDFMAGPAMEAEVTAIWDNLADLLARSRSPPTPVTGGGRREP